jgi:hypothetical protein
MKTFKLPGRQEQFLMDGDVVYVKSHEKKNLTALVRDAHGQWNIIQAVPVLDERWVKTLDAAYHAQ